MVHGVAVVLVREAPVQVLVAGIVATAVIALAVAFLGPLEAVRVHAGQDVYVRAVDQLGDTRVFFIPGEKVIHQVHQHLPGHRLVAVHVADVFELGFPRRVHLGVLGDPDGPQLPAFHRQTYARQLGYVRVFLGQRLQTAGEVNVIVVSAVCFGRFLRRCPGGEASCPAEPGVTERDNKAEEEEEEGGGK